jgi:predicted pyridoxine 5'-phosphate oxidase superfamily flavin-nucleotide-binding protein
MGHKFAEIAFTESIRKVQQEQGSRDSYAIMAQGDDYNNVLGPVETSFIGMRDSFYMASVSETGWPYVQHRGGPVGFVKILNEQTIGFSDFQGNRQYVSTGNFRKNRKVSLFFMDYPNKRRLKLLGQVRQISNEEKDLLGKLESPEYPARVERGFEITIAAFDWNCPQHITPRFSQTDVDQLMSPLIEEIQQLKFQLEISDDSEQFSF